MNLRNKMLVSYLLVSTIPIVAISSIIFKVSADSISESSQQFASMYVSEVTSSLDNFERNYDRISRSVLSQSSIIQILNAPRPSAMAAMVENQILVRDFFVHMASVYPELRSLMLRGNNGLFFAWCQDPGSIDAKALAAQDWFKDIEMQDAYPFFISPVHDRSYYTGDRAGATLTVGRKIWNYSGKYIGAIFFDLNPSQFATLNAAFLELGRKNSIRLVITDYENRRIYDSDAITGVRQPSTAISADRSSGARPHADKATLSLSQVSSSGRLCASVEIPYVKLLGKIQRVGLIMVVLNLVCLGAIAFFAFSYSNRIVRPIRDLQRSMLKVDGGVYSNLVKSPKSDDEISSLVDSYNTMIIKIRELLENVYMAEIKEKHARLQSLQSQINPHMLYNTLESIRMKAVVQEQEQIAEMIKVLARMFKHSLRSDSQSNLVRDELRYAADYLYIQNVRYDNRFSMDERLSESVKDTPIIPMVFQPIIENSVKHGFRTHSTVLHILITQELIPPNMVKIRIADDGVGIPSDEMELINKALSSNEAIVGTAEEASTTSSGIGLMNLAQRLRLQYGEEFSLRVYSEEGRGFRVDFLLPFQAPGDGEGAAHAYADADR
jgi:Predicted signal transduction protein with a C-terminal ATPase domain